MNHIKPEKLEKVRAFARGHINAPTDVQIQGNSIYFECVNVSNTIRHCVSVGGDVFTAPLEAYEAALVREEILVMMRLGPDRTYDSEIEEMLIDLTRWNSDCLRFGKSKFILEEGSIKVTHYGTHDETKTFYKYAGSKSWDAILNKANALLSARTVVRESSLEKALRMYRACAPGDRTREFMWELQELVEKESADALHALLEEHPIAGSHMLHWIGART